MYFHFSTLKSCLREALRSDNFSWRHLFFIALFMVPFLMLRTIVWTIRRLDRYFYPKYPSQKILNPIYIIGNPRSGTTFLHRLISHDHRFTHFNLLQTIFPAIAFYKISNAFAKLDRRLGHPLLRLLHRVSAKGFEGWNTIHKTGPLAVESDEMLFVYTMLSPLIGLLFPYFDALDSACFVDRLPEKERRRLMAYYRDSLKRHIYATGPDRILLEKVALIAGRLDSILETLPDMRLVHMVRHPYESIPSLISMFSIPWRTLAPRSFENQAVNRSLAELIFSYYRHILAVKRTLPPHRYVEIHYADLVADPNEAVQRIYAHFGLTMHVEHRQFIERETRKAADYKSGHKYSLEQFGLTRAQVFQELREVFDVYGFDP